VKPSTVIFSMMMSLVESIRLIPNAIFFDAKIRTVPS